MTKEKARRPNIAISPSTKERLEKIGKFGETYDDIIRRMLDEKEVA